MAMPLMIPVRKRRLRSSKIEKPRDAAARLLWILGPVSNTRGTIPMNFREGTLVGPRARGAVSCAFHDQSQAAPARPEPPERDVVATKGVRLGDGHGGAGLRRPLGPHARPV